MNRLQGKAGWTLLAVAALVFPLFAQNNYLISVATQAFIMAIAALGLNLITGYTAPSAGEILFKGRAIGGARPHTICHLGIVTRALVTHERVFAGQLEINVPCTRCLQRRTNDASGCGGHMRVNITEHQKQFCLYLGQSCERAGVRLRNLIARSGGES